MTSRDRGLRTVRFQTMKNMVAVLEEAGAYTPESRPWAQPPPAWSLGRPKGAAPTLS